MEENRRPWIGSLAWGLVVGALLAIAVRAAYVVFRAMWDYRREVTPAVPPLIGLPVGGSSSLPAETRVVVAVLAIGLAVLLARHLWTPESLQAGRTERFLASVRRAWPRIAARSIGGRRGSWRAVRATPSAQGVDLEVLTPVGFSAQDVAYRADAVAAAYSAAGCSVTRDPHRANLVHLSIHWSPTPTPIQPPPISHATPRPARP